MEREVCCTVQGEVGSGGIFLSHFCGFSDNLMSEIAGETPYLIFFLPSSHN